MADPIYHFIERARQRRGRVVLPEVDDPRIQEAARILRDEGIAEPILPDPASSPKLDAYASLFPGNPKIALRAVRKPLFHAGMMVRAGDADAMVAGVSHPTRRLGTSAASSKFKSNNFGTAQRLHVSSTTSITCRR